MEKSVAEMLSSLSKTSAFISPDVKQEASEMCINGINVMRIPSRDAYAFALQFIDVLFTKEELALYLLFKSKKSSKPGLDSVRVQQLLSFIDNQYGADKWDMKTLTAKVNQKCRDSGVTVKKDEDSAEHELELTKADN